MYSLRLLSSQITSRIHCATAIRLCQSFQEELAERARLEKVVAVQNEQIVVLRQKAAAHEAVIEELRVEVGISLDYAMPWLHQPDCVIPLVFVVCAPEVCLLTLSSGQHYLSNPLAKWYVRHRKVFC